MKDPHVILLEQVAKLPKVLCNSLKIFNRAADSAKGANNPLVFRFAQAIKGRVLRTLNLLHVQHSTKAFVFQAASGYRKISDFPRIYV